MVHWIYVLECKDKNIYVGETTRLYKRFNEHMSGSGSQNTGLHKPNKLIGLYKVGDNFSFMNYRQQIINKSEYNIFTINNWGNEEDIGYLDVENHITEIYFYLRSNDTDDNFLYCDGEWQKIKGGKYTKHNILNNPTELMNKSQLIDRPCCDCGYPCEVKISRDKNSIYYVCALNNVWDGFFRGFKIGRPCDFHKIYDEDTNVKKQYKINVKKLGESWMENIPISQYKIHPEPCIKCNKTGYMPVFSFGSVRRLCQDCLSNAYEDLRNKYSDICLIR